MQVNGFKTFKIETVSDTGIPGPTPEEEAQQEGQIEDYFAPPPDAGAGSPPPNSVAANDYTFGDIQGDTVATGSGSSDITTWLQDPVPDINEILIGNENAINYLDIILARYEQLKEDLLRLQQAYQLEIDSGEATASRIEELTALMGLINAALARCDQQIQNVDAKAQQAGSLYLDEKRAMKDLNGDSWVGRPFANGSYYIRVNDDGEVVYYDPRTKQAIANPLMDPDYVPTMMENDNLSIVDKGEDYVPSEGQGPAANVYLKLNESALMNLNGPYNTAIDWGIPQYMWVERNGDGNGPDPYKMEWNIDGTGGMALYDEWEDGAGGFRQKAPADLSEHMQVQVTGARFSSEWSGVNDASGNKLYDTVIELYNGDTKSGTLIARFRIEGTYVGGAIGPAADTGSADPAERWYVGASSVGISFNGKKLGSSIQVDASSYRSTARHTVNDFSALGIEEPSDVGNAQASYNHNLDAFRPGVDGYDAYGGYTDLYVAENAEAPGDDDINTPDRLVGQTGIFGYAYRGDTAGTAYNDILWTAGVNDYSQSPYALEHMPQNGKPITKDDAFYANRVDAGNGNNIVIAGAGDNYIYGATFAWVENQGQGENFIALQNINISNEATAASQSSANPQSFVHATGGAMTYLYNPSEYNPTVTASVNEVEGDNAATQNAVTEAQEEYENDDYYYISGSFKAHDPNDTDFDPSSHPISNTTAGDYNFWSDAGNTGMEGWLDELMKIPSADESEAPVNWDEINGEKTSLDDEMNSFFDTMFGEMDGFLTESDGGQGQI